MSSTDQFNRITGLVAELTRREREGMAASRIGALATRFGTTASQIGSDIRTLTLLGDDADADWLLSLSVWQEGDQVSITSGGPYQRPIRFTAEELMAMQLGLADAESELGSMSTDLARVMNNAERVSHALAGRGRVTPRVSSLFRDAIGDRRKVEISYAGERSLGGTNRVIHPYQLLEQEGCTYVVAWCELAEGWRHFREDRVLDALALDVHYAPRSDFVPAGHSFAEPPEGVTPVQVRFSPTIARWIRERYPDAVAEPEGGVVVTYLVASPEWLVRHVLQYGPDAEVVGPAGFRDLMRKELAP